MIRGPGGGKGEPVVSPQSWQPCSLSQDGAGLLACWEGGWLEVRGPEHPCRCSLCSSPPSLINACPSSGPQVLHLYCDTCSVPICRECTMGRHGGHSFIYLQEALQDSRALTIQLLADAQQGRQAIQVSLSPPFTSFPRSSLDRKHVLPHCLSDGMYRLLGRRRCVGAMEQ